MTSMPTQIPRTSGFWPSFTKAYHFLGFSKAYNFLLFIFTIGSLMGFALARLSYLNFYGVFCRPNGELSAVNNAAPGECYYLLQKTYTVGMILHLSSILPATILACSQFVPVIRHRIILLHRINGYIVITLSITSVIGALIVTRHSFGGGLDVQSSIGTLAILFLSSNFMAYINIKKLQIEQHRAWMLRAWTYAGSVITTRLILFTGAAVISRLGGFFVALPCAQIKWILGDEEQTLHFYPDCAPFLDNSDIDRQVAVLGSVHGSSIEATAAYNLTYGMAHWIAIVLHVVFIEVYVSFQRQLEAGMKEAGSSGWTANRLGDGIAWFPQPSSKLPLPDK